MYQILPRLTAILIPLIHHKIFLLSLLSAPQSPIMHQQYCHLTSFLEPLVCFQSLFSLPIFHEDGPFSSFLEAPVYLQPITFSAATHTGLVTVEVSTPD